MPRSCGRPPFEPSEGSCAERTSFRDDPTKCAFPAGCPFELLLDDPEVSEIYRFCVGSLDHWTSKKDKHSREEHHYGVSIEKFDLACRLYEVDNRDQREAFEWCSFVATAANDAQQEGLRRAREAAAKQRRR